MHNYRFGNYLYELRTKKKMTQTELAELLGVTNKAVSKWEAGAAYPSSKLIYPLAKALGVSVEEIYRMMSESEKERNGIRRMLDKLFEKKQLAFLVPMTTAAVLYVLFLIFSDMPEKTGLAVSAPIVSAFIFGGILLIFLFQLKNPLCPENFLDVIEFALLLISGLSSLILTISFLLDIEKGFSIGCIIGMIIWSAMSIVHNKRK